MQRPRHRRDPEYATWWLDTWGDPIDHAGLTTVARRLGLFRAELTARARVPELIALLERQREELAQFWETPAAGEDVSLYDRFPAALAEALEAGPRLGIGSGVLALVEEIYRERIDVAAVHISRLREARSDPRLLLPQRSTRAPDVALSLACAEIAEWLEARGGADRAPIGRAIAGCLEWWGEDLSHIGSDRGRACLLRARRWRRDQEPRWRKELAERIRQAERDRRRRAEASRELDDAMDQAEALVAEDESTPPTS